MPMKAREEILFRLINKGWIRIRRYENRYWSKSVGNWSPKASRLLLLWARRMLGPGISGRRDADQYMPVLINGIGDILPRRELFDHPGHRTHRSSVGPSRRCSREYSVFRDDPSFRHSKASNNPMTRLLFLPLL